jgi:hypothetical protein
MPALPRRLSLAGLLAWTLCAPAGQGYLPVVGPPPLRFENPQPAPLPEVVLPPLPVIEPRMPAGQLEPTATTPAPVNPGVDARPGSVDESTNADPALTIVQPFVVPFSPLTAEPWASSVPGSAVSMIAPQMFMKYFTGQPGTNSVGVSIFAPVGFVPPVPPPAPSSTATFETVPAGKP